MDKVTLEGQEVQAWLPTRHDDFDTLSYGPSNHGDRKHGLKAGKGEGYAMETPSSSPIWNHQIMCQMIMDMETNNHS